MVWKYSKMYINLPRWAKDQKETKAKALKARMKRGNITIDPWEEGKERRRDSRS